VVPFSRQASAEARAAFIAQLAELHADKPKDLVATRARYDRISRARVAAMRALYPVTIVRSEIDGVPVETITPAGGVAPANHGKVLINIHGGSFMFGGGGPGGEVEAIPIAALGGIPVVAVDYRLAPEHRFPAASEDVTAVYRWLLKSHAAGSIGIYGCSAGGIITGETIAWLQAQHLPRPGAIGTFCASIADLGGDSDFTAPALLGLVVPNDIPPITGASNGYLDGQSPDDPLIRPSASRAVLAAFPPTLLITGTRDFAMSNVIQSDRLLTEAGVDAELHVWDGMWHAFFMDPGMPESREAYRVIAGFFDRHLQ
jgi:acetyl esterase/lipase